MSRRHWQGSRQQQERFDLKFETLEVKPGEVQLIATLTRQKGHTPEQNVEVEFLHQSRVVGTDYTDENGRALHTASGLEPGIHRFEAKVEIAEQRLMANPRTVRVAGPKKSVPDKLEVRALGRDGKYVVTVTVMDTENRPLEGVLVEVYDEYERIAPGRTNADGVLEPEPEVEFTERWKTITVQVPGFKSRELRLAGPRPKRPPPTPEPADEELQGNPLKVFVRGWRAGKDAIQQQATTTPRQGREVDAPQSAETPDDPLRASVANIEDSLAARRGKRSFMPAVKRSLWRAAFALASNNNWRLFALWALTAVWLAGHLWLFGLGPAAHEESGFRQAVNHYYLTGELRETGKAGLVAGVVAGIGEALRNFSKWSLFVLAIASLVYPFFAFKDEVMAASYAAERKILERRGGLTDLPNVPIVVAPGAGTATVSGGAKALSLRDYVSIEFLMGFVHELVPILFRR